MSHLRVSTVSKPQVCDWTVLWLLTWTWLKSYSPDGEDYLLVVTLSLHISESEYRLSWFSHTLSHRDAVRWGRRTAKVYVMLLHKLSQCSVTLGVQLCSKKAHLWTLMCDTCRSVSGYCERQAGTFQFTAAKTICHHSRNTSCWEPTGDIVCLTLLSLSFRLPWRSYNPQKGLAMKSTQYLLNTGKHLS